MHGSQRWKSMVLTRLLHAPSACNGTHIKEQRIWKTSNVKCLLVKFAGETTRRENGGDVCNGGGGESSESENVSAAQPLSRVTGFQFEYFLEFTELEIFRGFVRSSAPSSPHTGAPPHDLSTHSLSLADFARTNLIYTEFPTGTPRTCVPWMNAYIRYHECTFEPVRHSSPITAFDRRPHPLNPPDQNAIICLSLRCTGCLCNVAAIKHSKSCSLLPATVSST